MHCYLQPDEYKSIYGNKTSDLLQSYSSVQEILSLNDKSTNEQILKCRIECFNKLKEQADKIWEATPELKEIFGSLNDFEAEFSLAIVHLYGAFP